MVAGFDFDFVSVMLIKGYMTLLILLCFALIQYCCGVSLAVS